MQPLIELKNCTLMRDDVVALNNVSFVLNQHESVVLLGPNGSGKSSLLKMLYRELYPLERETSCLKVLDDERFDLASYRKQLGIVSSDIQQNYYPDTRGLEVVISGYFDSNSLWQHHDIEQSQIESALNLIAGLGISDLTDEPFGKLSLGQQRRLLLARAMVHKPKILILDEPTVGLDLFAGKKYMADIRFLLKTGVSIILATHIISEIPPEIDRIVFIKEGAIVEDGLKDNLLTSEKLSELFNTNVSVESDNGYFRVYSDY